jgi:hypothetical protein
LGAMTEEQLLVGLRNAGVDLGHDPAETLADLLDGDELRAGDLVGFRVTTAGMDITASTRAPRRGRRRRGVASTILAECGGDEQEQLDSVVWTACADDPGLCRTPVAATGSLCVRGSRETRRNSASATRTGVRVSVARPRGAHHVDHRP